MNGLEQAVKVAGSQVKLAALLGVQRSTVNKWGKRGRIPPEQCASIERATGIARKFLRPDIYE